MLRQGDGRRKILCFPIEEPDLGAGAKKRLPWFRAQTRSRDFKPAFVVIPAAEQGWQEVVCDWTDLSRGVDALRLEVQAVCAVSRRNFRGVCCLLERRAVGDLRFLSRRHAVAQQGRWQRAPAIDLSPDVSRAPALVAR